MVIHFAFNSCNVTFSDANLPTLQKIALAAVRAFRFIYRTGLTENAGPENGGPK